MPQDRRSPHVVRSTRSGRTPGADIVSGATGDRGDDVSEERIVHLHTHSAHSALDGISKLPDVRHRFLGSFEHFLDRSNIGFAQNEFKADLGISTRRLRLGRQHLLYRLCHFRDPEQPDHAQGGRQVLDCPDHGDLGPDLGGNVLRLERHLAVCRPIPLGCRRGRLLPRRHPVPDILDPQGLDELRSGPLLHGRPDRNDPWEPHVRPHQGRAERTGRRERVEVDVYHRGSAGRRGRHLVVVLPEQQALRCALPSR